MSSGVSILLTVLGFFKPQNQKRYFWIASAGCFFLGSVRVWTTEHEKVLSKIASLDASTAKVAFAGDPFPIGLQVSVLLVWHNFGPSDAVRGKHSAKIYILPSDDRDSQGKMIADWRTVASTDFARSPGDPIFHAGTDKNIGVSSTEVVDDDLRRSLFAGMPKHLFVISAVQFTDGGGDHEAHACLELAGVNGQGLNWRECQDYVTPIDIPRRAIP